MVPLLRMAGRIQAEDARGWRRWLSSHHEHLTDAAWAQGDWKPGALMAAKSVFYRVLHARSTWREARSE